MLFWVWTCEFGWGLGGFGMVGCVYCLCCFGWWFGIGYLCCFFVVFVFCVIMSCWLLFMWVVWLFDFVGGGFVDWVVVVVLSYCSFCVCGITRVVFVLLLLLFRWLGVIVIC